MAEEDKKHTISDEAYDSLKDADANGDGHISAEEMAMHMEFKRKELEDQDAQRDAMRKMAWFALIGMLLYPATILVTSLMGADKAAGIIGDIAPTYFVAIAGLVAAFFGADAIKSKK
jgi:FtsH-binding integral membrane protein